MGPGCENAAIELGGRGAVAAGICKWLSWSLDWKFGLRGRPRRLVRGSKPPGNFERVW